MGCEEPISLRYGGMEFVRPGDKLLYMFERDLLQLSLESCVLVELLSREVEERAESPTWKDGRSTYKPAWSQPVRFLEDYEGNLINPIKKGSIVLAEEGDLFWDPSRDIPASRLREFLHAQFQTMEREGHINP